MRSLKTFGMLVTLTVAFGINAFALPNEKGGSYFGLADLFGWSSPAPFTTQSNILNTAAFAPGVCDTGMNIDVEATAGTAQTGYSTLAAAIAAINAGTHQGVINVEVCASTTETAAMFLNSNAATPASYTSVSIYPLVDGLTISGPTVTGRGLIELNGADNVTIDGDNPLTAGTNRNLTITNTAAVTVNLTSVIRIAVVAAVPNADNNTFRNLNINGSAVARNVAGLTSTTNSENSSFGIYAGGLATGAITAPGALTSVSTNTAASGTTINTFNATNNAVNACARGIFFNGAVATVSTGVTIANNLIGDQVTVNTGAPPFTSPTTTVYTKAVFVAGTTAVTITNNSIKNILSYVGTTMNAIELNSAIGAGGVAITGNTIDTVVNNGSSVANGLIHTQSLGTYNVSSNIITNIQSTASSSVGLLVAGTATSGTVAKNKITTVRSRSTGGVRAGGIVVSSGNSVTIQNNFVSEVLNIGSASFSTSFNANGILLLGGVNHKVYHNSVNLFGVSTSVGSNSVNCLAITASSQTGIDVRNNVFVNQVTGGAATDAHVAVFLPFTASATMLLMLNNNDYYVGSIAGKSGVAFAGATSYAAANVYDAANFDPTMTTPATNFRSFSTLLGVPTNDNASKKVDPLFVSSSDLHIQTSSTMESMGANASVADDIDGDVRGGTPDIGADEITLAGPGTLEFSAASYTNLENNVQTITVNRTGGLSGAVSVMYATSDGTATGSVACVGAADYVSTSGTLNWADMDSAAKTFTVSLCGDGSAEPTETVVLTLSMPTGTTITGTNPATLNITDNPPGTIQFSSASFNGAEGSMATITATRTLGSFGAVSVAYATSDGTATVGGLDYTAASGTLNWADGDSASKTFTVPMTCDIATEGTETVNLTLSAPTGGAIIGATNPAVLNIADALGACAFCNGDGPISIPSSGTATPYPSTVTVSGAVGTITSMRVTLNNVTHTFSDDIDVLLVGPGGQKFILVSDAGGSTGAVNQTLTFSDAAATQLPDSTFITGTYRPANYDAANDTFAVPAPVGPYGDPGPGGTPAGTATLNGTFGGGSPNGTWSLYVVDDASGDSGTISGWCLDFMTVAPNPGEIQFSTTTYAGNEGTTAIITATRTAGNAGAVSVDYATSNGTATAGTCGTDDYVAATGTLNWADMDTAAKTFTVTLCSDAVSDPAETVNLTLSNPTGGVTIGLNNPAVLTIGDVPPPTHQFSSAAFLDDESQVAVITVTRTGDTSGASSVDFATVAGGTATPGASCSATDFVTASGTLNFLATETSKTFNVQLCADGFVDPAETVNLALSNPVGGTLGVQNTAVLTINDTATQFMDMTPNSIPGAGTGSSTPPHSPALVYPATINVSGAPVVISSMRVTLYDVQHTFSADMDFLLVGPGGQTFVLMAEAGAGTGTDAVTTITLDDASPTILPASGVIASDSYEPANYVTPITDFPSPAPVGPYGEPGSTLQNLGGPSLTSIFGGTNANGAWNLYIRDTASGDIGTMSGWGLEFLAPSAANASITGRVLTANGGGIRNALVTVSGGSLTVPRYTNTGTFGYYRFDDLEVGQTYVVSVNSKRFAFLNPTILITLQENVLGANFEALPE